MLKKLTPNLMVEDAAETIASSVRSESVSTDMFHSISAPLASMTCTASYTITQDDLGKNPGGAIFIVANFSARNAKDHRTIIPLEKSEITSYLVVVKSSNSLVVRSAEPAE